MSSIWSREPNGPIRKQPRIGLCEPQALRSRGDRVSLCVREPQTAPQSPRMGCNLSEKTLCWIDPRTEKATPKVFAWGGRSDDVTGSNIAARPEVTINTLHLGQNHVVFCLIWSRKVPIYSRDISDVLVTSRPWVNSWRQEKVFAFWLNGSGA